MADRIIKLKLVNDSEMSQKLTICQPWGGLLTII